MSDLKKYIDKRRQQDTEIWKDYNERIETFKNGILLKQALKQAGMNQEKVARELKKTKYVISRMENHATDIRLSTLEKFAKALGRRIEVSLV